MTEDTFPTRDDPAPDPRVRSLLAAAAAPAETAGPLPGEGEALAAFRAAQQSTKRTLTLPRLVSARTAVASAIGTGVLLAGGVGAAVAGVLPGASQETVSRWLDTVGISVPTGERADENNDPRDRSEQTPAEATAKHGDPRDRSEQAPAEEAAPPPAVDHGKRVSETAKDSTAEGADKGKEIAKVASDGRVKSGNRGPTQTPPGQKRAGEHDHKPPASTPNPNRTGTAPNATNSQSNPPGPPTPGQ